MHLKRLVRRGYRVALAWGFDPRKTIAAVKWSPKVRRDLAQLREQAALSESAKDFAWGERYPILDDLGQPAGLGGHYLYQDVLVAREIYARKPRRHIDLGSSVHGFVSAVASFRDIEVIDVRPMHVELPGVSFLQLDAGRPSPEFLECADSISCLHALEHFGLGRYGDEVDVDGWLKGLDFMTRLLEPDGVLYLSVPAGQVQRIEFNAHRVFSIPYLRRVLQEDYDVEHLSFVTDDGRLVSNVDLESREAASTFHAHYGCAIWTLRKRKTSEAGHVTSAQP